MVDIRWTKAAHLGPFRNSLDMLDVCSSCVSDSRLCLLQCWWGLVVGWGGVGCGHDKNHRD